MGSILKIHSIQLENLITCIFRSLLPSVQLSNSYGAVHWTEKDTGQIIKLWNVFYKIWVLIKIYEFIADYIQVAMNFFDGFKNASQWLTIDFPFGQNSSQVI